MSDKLSKEELNQLSQPVLRTMEIQYVGSPRKNLKLTKEALVKRLMGKVPKTATRQLEETKYPLLRLLPDDIVYKINYERNKLEKPLREAEFVKTYFEQATLYLRTDPDIYFSRNYDDVDIKNINSSNYFIKDFTYLVKYFKINEDELEDATIKNKKIKEILEFINNNIIAVYHEIKTLNIYIFHLIIIALKVIGN